MIPLCIIGYGITGMLLLMAAEQQNIPPEHICVIDPYFDGGDLQRIWPHVKSNTPWSKVVAALQLLNPTWKCPPAFSSIQPHETTPVSFLVKCIRQSISSYFQKCKKLQDTACSIEKNTSGWTITCSKEKINAHLLCVTTGMKAKEFSCDIPQIPLSVALNKGTLQTYLTPSDSVVVFGTSHSGTLVLSNLEECHIQTTALYKHAQPFYFDRDGHYDGIKEDSAIIADAILQDKYKYITLLSLQDIPRLIKTIRSATWCISAIGFQPNHHLATNLEDSTLWKLGAAFPPTAPDGIHKDVSVLIFAQQVQKVFPELLEKYRGLDFHTSL